MTKSEFVQISTSFGIKPEMRGFSVVLAAYTGPSYSDWVAIYDHNNNNTGIVNGSNIIYKTSNAFKSALSKRLLQFKNDKLKKRLHLIQQDF